MCVWLGAVWVEWMRELGMGFTNPMGTGGVLDMCVFWLRRWGVGSWLEPGLGAVGWCMSV